MSGARLKGLFAGKPYSYRVEVNTAFVTDEVL